MLGIEELIGVGAEIVALARRERIVLTAASLAYFSFISMVPVLLFLVFVLTILGGEPLAMRAASRAAHTLTPESSDALRTIVFSAANGRQATVVGGVVLLWSALLTFRALNTAFAGIYGTHGETSFRKVVADVVLVFVVIVATALTMVTGGAVLSVFVQTRLWETLGPVVSFAVLVVVFTPLYYILPDVDVEFREVLPGTLFAAGAWTVLQALFSYYTSFSGVTQLYGTESTFLVVLIWLYIGGFVILVGAALNAVLADRVDPDPKWRPVDL